MTKLTETVVAEFSRIVVDCLKNNELIGENKIVCKKELKGKNVVAFNVSRFVNVSGKFSVPPSKVSETVEIILEGLKKAKDKWEKLGKPEVCYFRQSLNWKKDGPNYERFVKIWNKTEGSAMETSEKFGKNDWGEILLTPQNVKQRVSAINKAEGENSPLCKAKDEKIAELTEDKVADIIAELDI